MSEQPYIWAQEWRRKQKGTVGEPGGRVGWGRENVAQGLQALVGRDRRTQGIEVGGLSVSRGEGAGGTLLGEWP